MPVFAFAFAFDEFWKILKVKIRIRWMRILTSFVTSLDVMQEPRVLNLLAHLCYKFTMNFKLRANRGVFGVTQTDKSSAIVRIVLDNVLGSKITGNLCKIGLGLCYLLTGSFISAFDWYQNWWPWMSSHSEWQILCHFTESVCEFILRCLGSSWASRSR